MQAAFKDIPGCESWTKVTKVEYGWSADAKYLVEDADGRKYLLRCFSLDVFEQKEKEFEIIRKFNTLDFVMSHALQFGMLSDASGAYMLLSWVAGQPLEQVISELDVSEQYDLGVRAGGILRLIHGLPVDAGDIPAANKIPRKLLQLQRYEGSAVRIAGDEDVILFIRRNIGRLCKTAPVYTHGDFHIGNLVYTPEREIGVIDFNRWECGDRYEEFYKVQSFDVEASIPFAVGQLQGYFAGEPPADFWEAQAVYVAHASLYSLKWAEAYGEAEVDGMKKRCLAAMSDYDNFNELTPKWYRENKDRWR